MVADRRDVCWKGGQNAHSSGPTLTFTSNWASDMSDPSCLYLIYLGFFHLSSLDSCAYEAALTNCFFPESVLLVFRDTQTWVNVETT
jgi:hypothetical protein